MLERHPFPPFLPHDAKVLIMGTFPPKPIRWSMNFYYPNKTNDFWRIMGLIFYGDTEHFRDTATGGFHQTDIEQFLRDKKIALHDTGASVRRLKDNASDKFLEIVEPVNLDALLSVMPNCNFIATTGEKAAGVIASITQTELPKIGEVITTVYPYPKADTYLPPRQLHITRMPSTSRAYPLKVEKKAEFYRNLFITSGIL